MPPKAAQPPRTRATPEQRAAMRAASEKLNDVDRTRARAYADKWIKNEAPKRLSGKQMPKAEQAVLSEQALNTQTKKTIDKLETAFKRAYHAPAANNTLRRAYIAKEVADKAAKVGMNTASAAAVATAMALGYLAMAGSTGS